MKRFHWHSFQIDPFIDCYETNYIYIPKAEWNQTDRPKSDKEEIREFDSPLKGVPPSSQGRDTPFIAAEVQRPAPAGTSIKMGKPNHWSLETSVSYFGKICFCDTSTPFFVLL